MHLVFITSWAEVVWALLWLQACRRWPNSSSVTAVTVLPLLSSSDSIPVAAALSHYASSSKVLPLPCLESYYARILFLWFYSFRIARRSEWPVPATCYIWLALSRRHSSTWLIKVTLCNDLVAMLPCLLKSLGRGFISQSQRQQGAAMMPSNDEEKKEWKMSRMAPEMNNTAPTTFFIQFFFCFISTVSHVLAE